MIHTWHLWDQDEAWASLDQSYSVHKHNSDAVRSNDSYLAPLGPRWGLSISISGLAPMHNIQILLDLMIHTWLLWDQDEARASLYQS